MLNTEYIQTQDEMLELPSRNSSEHLVASIIPTPIPSLNYEFIPPLTQTEAINSPAFISAGDAFTNLALNQQIRDGKEMVVETDVITIRIQQIHYPTTGKNHLHFTIQDKLDGTSDAIRLFLSHGVPGRFSVDFESDTVTISETKFDSSLVEGLTFFDTSSVELQQALDQLLDAEVLTEDGHSYLSNAVNN